MSDVLVLHSLGRVGINTIPAYELDVCGTARAKEVIVETGWCDFVFEDDYDLRPLKEVAAFIEENHHLPEIPSAEVVETEGLKVAEMTTKMMQKIEELTLYIIDQQEQINTLRKQVEQQD